jgi:hypothetical protein
MKHIKSNASARSVDVEYELNIQGKENDKISCIFAMGRIQNIKPLVCNSKTNMYETNC